jgi:hypothetical protein
MSIQKYLDQVRELDIEGRSLEASSVEEAKLRIKEIRLLQRQLRHIKKLINADMKTIRAQFAEKKANTGEGWMVVGTLFGQRGAGRSARASAKRQVTAERNRVLAPYEKLKHLIDDYLVQLDRAKLLFEEYILDAEEE